MSSVGDVPSDATLASNCANCGEPIWTNARKGRTWFHVGGGRECADAPVATPIETPPMFPADEPPRG